MRLLFRASSYGLCVDMVHDSKFSGFSGDIILRLCSQLCKGWESYLYMYVCASVRVPISFMLWL